MKNQTEACLLTALLFLFLPTISQASISKDDNCWKKAGDTFGVDPILLYSIAEVESSHRPQIVSKKNSNGTRDIGIMQVNTTHLPALRSKGITKKDLLNPCINIFVGAWLLVDAKRVMGPNWEQGIGAYNAGVKKGPKRDRLRKKYANKIRPVYQRNLRLLNNKQS